MIAGLGAIPIKLITDPTQPVKSPPASTVGAVGILATTVVSPGSVVQVSPLSIAVRTVRTYLIGLAVPFGVPTLPTIRFAVGGNGV